MSGKKNIIQYFLDNEELPTLNVQVKLEPESLAYLGITILLAAIFIIFIYKYFR